MDIYEWFKSLPPDTFEKRWEAREQREDSQINHAMYYISDFIRMVRRLRREGKHQISPILLEKTGEDDRFTMFTLSVTLYNVRTDFPRDESEYSLFIKGHPYGDVRIYQDGLRFHSGRYRDNLETILAEVRRVFPGVFVVKREEGFELSF